MKDKIISGVAGAIIGWVVVFGYSVYFGSDSNTITNKNPTERLSNTGSGSDVGARENFRNTGERPEGGTGEGQRLNNREESSNSGVSSSGEIIEGENIDILLDIK